MVAICRLVDHPIAAWCGGQGTGGTAYFSFSEDVFRFLVDVSSKYKEAFQEWVREIIDWRLAEYVNRSSNNWNAERIVCRILQSNNRPILKLPNGCEEREEPWDWTSVEIIVAPSRGNRSGWTLILACYAQ